MSATDIYKEGARVWVPDQEEVWVSGTLKTSFKEDNLKSDYVLVIEIDNTQEKYIWQLFNNKSATASKELQLPPLRNPDILIGQNDLTTMSYLNEAEVLYNLQVRFSVQREIYTRCGIVLVAINPYEYLPIYSNEMIHAYSGQDVHTMDPHIFGVAEEAYKRLVSFEENQSIIVSGESGAGKTVSAKYTMRYFATVGGAENETQIEKRVLASNPLTEAIGNAKTIRNDNSSRFGKYLELVFGGRQNRIVGASMRTYLLEKSRVVFQCGGERNYHIFYQLCASNNLPNLQDLKLSHADDFFYTNQGDSPEIDGVDDALELKNTIQAMQILGIEEDDQMSIFRMFSAVLHLGNIVYQENDRGDSVHILDSSDALKTFCYLVGCDLEGFRLWLCNRNIQTAHEEVKKPLTMEQAIHARDALAKHIYAEVFDWLIIRVNSGLLNSSSGARQNATNKPQRTTILPSTSSKFIGVLDIYGFETFDVNSFEQFCINYANEKLQQQFNLHVFKLEQEEYVKEGIEWSFIQFSDNQPCIDLIENKLGILDLLDEECRMPKGSDDNWCQKLYKQHLEKSEHFSKPKMSNASFMIVHFADIVTYTITGFVEKNRDTVFEEQLNLLRLSRIPFVASIFQENTRPADNVVKSPSLLSSVQIGPVGGVRRSTTIMKKQMKKSVGNQFRDSLHKLMGTLNSTVPHYIRCIKPNDLKLPFTFSSKRAVQQLRACGVLETVRLSACGFPSRLTYHDFLRRYYMLVKSRELNKRDVQQSTTKIVTRIFNDVDRYRLGKTKIFFRAGQVAYLEQLRSERFRSASTTIQKHVRGWLARLHYHRVLRFTSLIQRHSRAYLARKKAQHFREILCAIRIQSWYRGLRQRRQYKKMLASIISCQRAIRWKNRIRRRNHFHMEHSATRCQAAIRGWLCRNRYQKFRRAVITLQSHFRRRKAKKEFRKLKIEARSINHVQNINKGLELKIIELTCNLETRQKEVQQMKHQQEKLVTLQKELHLAQEKEVVSREQNSRLSELETENAFLRLELNRERDEKQKIEKRREKDNQDNNQVITILMEEKFGFKEKLEDYEKKLTEKENENNLLQKELKKMRESNYDREGERAHHERIVEKCELLEKRHRDLQNQLANMEVSQVRRASHRRLGLTAEVDDETDQSTKEDNADNIDGDDDDGSSDNTSSLTASADGIGSSDSDEDSMGYEDENEELGRLNDRKFLAKEMSKWHLEEILAEYPLHNSNREKKIITQLIRIQWRNSYLESKIARIKKLQCLEEEEEDFNSKDQQSHRSDETYSSHSKRRRSSATSSVALALRPESDSHYYYGRIRDLESENRELNQQLTQLRNHVAHDQATQEIMKQFEAMRLELESRRKECLDLKTLLTDRSKAVVANDFYGGDASCINQDGELTQAFESQKKINEKLHKDINRLEAAYKFLEKKSAEDISLLKHQIVEQEQLISQVSVVFGNLNLNPQQRYDECVHNEIMRLNAENLKLRQELERYLDRQQKIARAVKFYAREALRLNPLFLSSATNITGTASHSLEALLHAMKDIPNYAPSPNSECDDSTVAEASFASSRSQHYHQKLHRGFLKFRPDDEMTFLTIIIHDIEPKTALHMTPCLPAYLLFMAMRYFDEQGNYNSLQSFVENTISIVKQVVSKDSIHHQCLWLANMCRLHCCMRQFAGESSRQDDYQSYDLKNYDLSQMRQIISDLIVVIYKRLIKCLQTKLLSSAVIIGGVLEHNGLSTLTAVVHDGVTTTIPNASGGSSANNKTETKTKTSLTIKSYWLNFFNRADNSKSNAITTSKTTPDLSASSSKPTTTTTQSNSNKEENRLDALMRTCSFIYQSLMDFHVDKEIIEQLFYQIFYNICAFSLNHLFMRKEFCTFFKAMHIKFNLSHLCNWVAEHDLKSAKVDMWLIPLSEASQLLQTPNNTPNTVKTICEICSHLNTEQVVKLMRHYIPNDAIGSRFQEETILEVQKRLKIIRSEAKINKSKVLRPENLAYGEQVMYQVNIDFPLNIPYHPIEIKFEDIELPNSSILPLQFVHLV